MKAVMESLQHRVGDTTKAPSTSVGIHASSPVEGETNLTFWLHGAESTANNFSVCQVVVLRWVLTSLLGVARTIALHATEMQSLRSRSINVLMGQAQSTPMNHENKVET